MRPDKSRWTLAASAPLALAAVLAAAPQAGAGVGGAAVSSPHVAADGTLTVEFTSAVSDQAADAAEARNVAASFVGEWAGQLIDEAARNNPPHAAATCRANATATDPNGATGTASADVPTGLNDTRVTYHEPAKWIARLRATGHGGPFLLKTEMEAGHGGRSGRYDAWREEALVLAWIIQTAGGAGPRAESPEAATPGRGR